MPLDEPASNKYYKLKGNLALWFAHFETRKFVRSWLVWFFIIASLTLVAIQASYLIRTYADLPTQVPFYMHLVQLEKRLAPTEFLFIIPLLSLAIFGVTVKLSNQFFHNDKHMSYFNLLIMALSISILTFVLIETVAPYYG